MTDQHFCTRCGEEYDWRDVEAPDDASTYWVPTCPVCNADVTATAVDETWLNIVGSDLDPSMDEYEYLREKLHAHARLYHGRLSGVSVEGLVERAKWFDDRVQQGRRWGPEYDRDVAFALRKQAREQASS